MRLSRTRGRPQTRPRGTERATSSGSTIGGMKPRVLLVEDEEAISEPLAELLAREGFDAEVAPTLDDAERRAPGEPARPRAARRDAARRRRSRPRPRDPQNLGRADRHAHRPRRGDRPGRRARARRRRLRGQAVQRPRADRADPRRSNGGRAARHAAVRSRSATIALDPAARTCTKGGEPLELAAKEFDLLHLLMANAGTVLTARADHGRGLGPALVRSDEDARRPRLVAPQEDRGRPDAPRLHHDRARRRLPVRRRRDL